MATVDQILRAAQNHGRESDPDHEVGDLQVLVRDLWALLTPQQRSSSFGRIIDWDEFIKTWRGR
jgi:hypothetical protein